MTTLLGKLVRRKNSVKRQTPVLPPLKRMNSTYRLIDNLEIVGVILHLWTFVYKSSLESIKEEQTQGD